MSALTTRKAVDADAVIRRKGVAEAVAAAFASGDGRQITQAIIYRATEEEIIAMHYKKLEAK